MKKRLLALLLAVAMITGILPVMAAAATGTPELDATSLSLSGILGVNLKYEANGANMYAYSVRFTIGSDTVAQELTDYTVDAKGRCVYTAKLPAHRMHESITVQLMSGDSEVSSSTWKVEDYLSAVKQQTNATQTIKELCDAVDYYGQFASAYAGDTTPSAAAEVYIQNVQASDVEAYKLTLGLNLAGASASLRLDDACDLRFSFAAWEDSWKIFDGDVDVTSQLKPNGDGKVYAVEEILPQDFAQLHAIKVMDGDTKKFEVSYGVLSYVYRVLYRQENNIQQYNAKLLNLLKAIYKYGAAAKGNPTLSDVYYATTTMTDAAKSYLTVEEDKNLKRIDFNYNSAPADKQEHFGLCVETDFLASDSGSYAREWEISGTIKKTEESSDTVPFFYLSFGVKSANGKSQYFGLYKDTVSLQNNGEPADTEQPIDGKIIQYNQATTSFYWDENSHL